MAIRSGFFNSVGGDRKYTADRFAEYFASFIGNGIFPNPSSNLQVIANDNMTVTVRAGKAWINGYCLISDDDYMLSLDVADGVMKRIDRVVVRYDIAGREIKLQVKKGAFSSTPSPIPLQRDADAYELALADIYIGNGAISVTQNDITDLRLDDTVCGIVHGTVEQVDITTLFNQYTEGFALKQQEFEEQFNSWIRDLQDVLDENTAGNLYNMIANLTAADVGAIPTTAIAHDLNGSAEDMVVSQAVVRELNDSKVDKVTGKGLSTNDYTNAEKAKVDAALPTTGGTMTGDLIAGGLQEETLAQVRNAVILEAGTTDFSDVPNNTLIFVKK